MACAISICKQRFLTNLLGKPVFISSLGDTEYTTVLPVAATSRNMPLCRTVTALVYYRGQDPPGVCPYISDSNL